MLNLNIELSTYDDDKMRKTLYIINLFLLFPFDAGVDSDLFILFCLGILFSFYVCSFFMICIHEFVYGGAMVQVIVHRWKPKKKKHSNDIRRENGH